MKVKILVEFEVEALENKADLDEAAAKAAASIAAYDHLALTWNGQDLTGQAIVFVDGFGECSVAVGEDHE